MNLKVSEKNKGITLTVLVITIAVILILSGVTINAIFADDGLINKSRDLQKKANQNIKTGTEDVDDLVNVLDNEMKQENTPGEDDKVTIAKIINIVVTENTKIEDAYGNKITIPKGFKIVPNGKNELTGDVTYTYSGDNIPAVQDGIVIENEKDGNQFVWVPVGNIKNKDNTTTTITLGRYSNFLIKDGAIASGQPVQVASIENVLEEVSVNTYYKELSTFREGTTVESVNAKNATARNLIEFISTTLENGGYYIARYEASGTTKAKSQYNQPASTNVTQIEAAKLARDMYGEIKENNELIYASDLVNSYAWDTAIIFIETCSTEEDASSYGTKSKSATVLNTGINADKYCNIWDMSSNVIEWSTEYTYYSHDDDYYPATRRGGYALGGSANASTGYRLLYSQTGSDNTCGFRPILYVK